jgi:peptidoglycan/LPS O-acetylase OafA/YrhL
MAPAPPLRPRYESLDIWRGLACLTVVWFHTAGDSAAEHYHTGLVNHGGSAVDWFLVAAARFWAGVPVFFVISGYCIAASADRVRDRAGVGRFFVRRVRRIYPPLWAVVGLLVAVTLLAPGLARPGMSADASVFRLTGWQWAGNLTLTESWRPAVGGPPADYALGQLWTLCYEEQFYLVVGLILAVARRWFFPAVALVTAAVLVNLSPANPVPVRVPGVFLDGLWLLFAAGVAVYYRMRSAGPAVGAVIEGGLVAFGLAALATDPHPWDSRQLLTKYVAVGCLFAFVLCRLHRFDATLAGAVWTAPLRACGRMCYSLYLTHPLVVTPVAYWYHQAGLTTPAATVLVTVPVCTLLSVGLAYAFYWLVERRFMSVPNEPAAVLPATTHCPRPAAVRSPQLAQPVG